MWLAEEFKDVSCFCRHLLDLFFLLPLFVFCLLLSLLHLGFLISWLVFCHLLSLLLDFFAFLLLLSFIVLFCHLLFSLFFSCRLSFPLSASCFLRFLLLPAFFSLHLLPAFLAFRSAACFFLFSFFFAFLMLLLSFWAYFLPVAKCHSHQFFKYPNRKSRARPRFGDAEFHPWNGSLDRIKQIQVCACFITCTCTYASVASRCQRQRSWLADSSSGRRTTQQSSVQLVLAIQFTVLIYGYNLLAASLQLLSAPPSRKIPRSAFFRLSGGNTTCSLSLLSTICCWLLHQACPDAKHALDGFITTQHLVQVLVVQPFSG